MVESAGANRIELECQVLTAALRCSWAIDDRSGRAKSCLELAQLFPDLVTPFDPGHQPPRNNYSLLEIDCDVSPRKVIVAYFRQAKKFLREHNPRQKRSEYYQLLDAGFMLRKPRLRLSHDMVVSRQQLIEQKMIQANGTFELAMPEILPAAAPAMGQPVAAQPQPVAQGMPGQAPAVAPGGAPGVAAPGMAPGMPGMPQPVPQQMPGMPPGMQPQPGVSGMPGQDPAATPPQGAPVGQPGMAPAAAQSQGVQPGVAPAGSQGMPPGAPPQAPTPPQPPAAPRLPAVVELLRASQLIAPTEVQALINQMRMFPGVSVVELILSAGYVTESEMKSVQLGEFLLGQGKINLGQFCVAMYDERSTGVKMAESLQTRGWLKHD